ncbi:MAG: Fur family transcriptional regulator [Desulfovibrionaceae bacterium]
MKTALQIFTEYLADHQLKMTQQRRAILDTFLAVTGHVSSEDLYERVKARDASIGQATVYRTLKLLADSGLASCVSFGDGVTRYEPLWGQEHHDHLICEACGRNLEILDERIEILQEELAEHYGFTLSHHKMYLYGLCPDCRKKADA